MALDVHLTREVNERWGFELLGGADDEMPLTIQKLQPSSPAARAGLQNGDTILTLNNEEAIDFTHEEASRKIAECGDSLNMAVMRGLYDPVLDDQEPIFYEPGDLDPESQPTEVPFKVQRFIEPGDLGSSLLDYGNAEDSLGTPYDPSVLLPETRSLTASPYVNPTKPYRPFSTEPIPEVPPLEDPIILNPNYKDQFGVSPVDINPDYILNAHYKNENLEAKYKLPISKQYDPDGTKKKIKNVEVESMLSKYVNMEMLSKKSVAIEKITKTSKKDVKMTETVSKDSKKTVKDVTSKDSLSKSTKEDVSFKKDVKITEQYETITAEREEEMIKEELKHIEKLKQELDIAQIEETAFSVVDDSIERAVSVAEEIKKEIEEELTSETKQTSETYEAEKRETSAKSKMETKESAEFIKTESIKEAEEIKDIQQMVVRKESKVQDEQMSQKSAREDTKEAYESKSTVSEQYEEKVINETPRQKDSYAQAMHSEGTFENKAEFKKVTKTVTTDDKTGAQQRTYALGLQTIPNIRGVVQSSYHYDLLLRTFFIHLTDVMVALSRFVLTQPVFNTESLERHETVSQTHTYESGAKDVRKNEHVVVESVKKVEKQKADESKKKFGTKQERIVEERKEVIKPIQEKKQEVKAVSQKTEKVQEKVIQKRELVTPVPEQEMKMESHQKIEKKTVSGAEMAQLTEKKLTKEMTQKMDALISEFQTVAVEEDKKEMFQRSRRSRSRSQIEEEVARESDPLEWLDKVDSRRASQEISEERLSKKEYTSSATFEKKHFEKLEKHEMKQKKTRTPKQMYRAIVEAHVYTDKDVIFEDASELSETSSVQSAEEMNTAFESIETMHTENVALESAVQQIEQAKIVEESQQLHKIHAQGKATIQKLEEVVHETTDIKQEEFKKEAALQSTGIQEVIIQETREIIEPVVEIKESIKKESVTVDINELLSIAESSKVNILELETTAIKQEEFKKEAAIQSTDIQEVIIQETKEIIEPVVEIKESIKKESVAVDINESLSIAESSEVNILELETTDIKQEEFKKEATIQSTDIQEVIIQETREIIEPVVEIKESIKKESVTVDINESLSIAESSKVNILELETTAIKLEEFKKEAAIQSTDIQEVIIQETKEIIEPVVEIKESIKKESVSVNINESLSIAESSEVNILESKSEFTSVESKKESVAIIEEEHRESAVVEAKAVVQAPIQIEEITEKVVIKKQPFKKEEEFAALKIVKEVETEVDATNEIVEVEEAVIKKIEISKELNLDLSKAAVVESAEAQVTTADIGVEQIDFSIAAETKMSSSKEIDISAMSNQVEAVSIQSHKSTSHVSEEIVQESSFTARSVDKKLSVSTDLETQESVQSEPSTIDTPTPSSVPPTPLVDEYLFKLSIPLPRSRSATPVPRDCSLSPEDEDPQIVKKKLIPHIETAIEEKIVYDPPLPTPPGDKLQSPIFKTPGLFGGASKPIYKIKFPPVYRKPGLYGGADNPEFSKEEIREIERKSSLLASAIDETIKSIEEYKEEVGMEKTKDVKVKQYKEEKVSKSYQESYSKKVVLESTQNGVESNNTTVIEEVIERNGEVANNIDTDDSRIKIIEVVKEEENVSSADKETLKEEKEVKIANKETVKEEQHIETANKVVVKEEESAKEVVKKEANIETESKKVRPTFMRQDSTKLEVNRIEHKSTVEEKAKTQDISVENIVTEIEKPRTVIIEVDETDNKESDISVVNKDVSEAATEPKVEIAEVKEEKESEKPDPMLGYRPVVFDPEAIQKRETPNVVIELPTPQEGRQSPYITDSGEIMGTIQGIVDGLDEPVMDPEIAKELGKPGISEEKIAELISGEAEMLREAHVMGLSRVLTSHMHRADDSVDFQKIKPMIDSLKDSEVLKALNEEMARQKEEQRKKEEKKWTTFLQKPKRPVPKAKYGYHGWTEDEQALVLEPYKVKIVKQAKPKVAPDYKPEDFDTGPLPWEQRAEFDASLPPVEPEEPILIPEVPEYLEAVDPTKESEVPDLEDTGLPLPPPRLPTPPSVIEHTPEEPPPEVQEPEAQEVEQVIEEENKENQEDMDNRLAEQLVRNVQSMVDPNASIEQQLCQMRAQLAALAQLPEVIQQTLELVSKQLTKMSHQEAHVATSASHKESHSYQEMEVTQNYVSGAAQEGIVTESNEPRPVENHDVTQHDANEVTIEEMETGGEQQMESRRLQTPQMMQQEIRVQTPQMTEEEIRMDKMKKEQAKLEAEARQLKQRPTPRVGKPKRMFGPLDPDSRPVVLPGGRRWRNSNDVYDEQKIAETLQAQSELIQGKVMGFESDLLPFDDRINFMKYEKPPVTLDHLQHSETYKLVHDMDQPPLKRVEMRTPVIAEADYRERCRSMTPAGEKKHQQIPQQFHP